MECSGSRCELAKSQDGNDSKPASSRLVAIRASPKPASMARRLFLSATFLSVAILLISGIALSTLYRRAAESNFDERLGVYLRALVADIATPGESGPSAPGQLGEPHFEIPYRGGIGRSRAWTSRSPRSEIRAPYSRLSFRAFPIQASQPESAVRVKAM